MTKHRTTVFLETDILQAMRKVAKDDERPMAYHYEKALRAYGPIKKLISNEPQKEVAPVKKPKAVDDYQFEGMWEAYGKKGNKKTSRAKFNKLDILDKHLIYDHIPIYVLSTPDKQYRKNFETYLNQECWNDEVITNAENQPGRTTAGRKLSVVERTRQRNAEREQARRAEERALDGSLVGEVTGNVWSPVEQPVRGDDTGELGTVIEGSCTTTD
jgi:hypothetical protein